MLGGAGRGGLTGATCLLHLAQAQNIHATVELAAR